MSQIVSPQLKTARFLANLLDNQFGVFGFRFGADAIIDLFPYWGDIIILGLSLYIVYLSAQLDVPRSKLVWMLINIVISFLIGLIPIAGDVVYLAFKPNMRNLAILEEHLTTHT